jgi:hypothetical protein
MRLYHRRLNRLIKKIETKLSGYVSLFDFDYTLCYPDEHKPHLSGSELTALMGAIEEQFKHSDGQAFTTLLNAFMSDKKIKARNLYTAALVEKSYFYQIRGGKHAPARDTVIRLALALKLNTEETLKLLQTLGYGFFEKSRRDIIIMACVEHRAGVYTAEVLLAKYGEFSLCNKVIL